MTSTSYDDPARFYWDMTKQALRAARRCRDEADDFDDNWRQRSLMEAENCRARARWYLGRWRMARDEMEDAA